MQSSTTVACRVGVMLTCLIAIPLAALFGTKLPGLVSRLLNRGQNSAFLSDEDPRSQAPTFDATVPGMAPSDPRVPSRWGVCATESPPPRVVPGEVPKASESSSRGASPAPTHYLGDLSGRSRSPLVPVSVGPTAETAAAISPAVFEPNASPPVRVGPSDSREDSAGAERALASAGGARSDHPAPLPPFVETPQSREIGRRLRELGASYYALETWGARGQFYRFHARMAAAHGAHYVRHFDAVDRDAARAMASVLDQVERWHADQGQLGSAFPP